MSLPLKRKASDFFLHPDITWEAALSERGSAHSRTPGNRPEIDLKECPRKAASHLSQDGVEHEIQVAHLVAPC